MQYILTFCHNCTYVSSLYHESRYNSMERATSIANSFFSCTKRAKIFGCLWNNVCSQKHYDSSDRSVSYLDIKINLRIFSWFLWFTLIQRKWNEWLIRDYFLNHKNLNNQKIDWYFFTYDFTWIFCWPFDATRISLVFWCLISIRFLSSFYLMKSCFCFFLK